MNDFRDHEFNLHAFKYRVTVAIFFTILCFSLLIIRFAYLQIFHFGKYSLQANENRISIIPIIPNRGIIMDRNGIILARNYSAYTLEIIPSHIKCSINKLIDNLSQIIPINSRDRHRFKKLQEDSKNFESLPIRTRLTDKEVALFTVCRYKFPGVTIHTRLFRYYPLGKTAAHVIGYIGRISELDKKHINAISIRNENTEKYDPYSNISNYKGTTYIGKIGIEQSYETTLHGLTGFKQVEVTASGKPVRILSYIPSIPGKNLKLSIDISLQQTAEYALSGKHGALVAIEPKTGEILAFVSSPSFNPNLFIDGIDQQNWIKINNSHDYPLLNRPLNGIYPPGSTYKPFMALAALTLKKRTPQWSYYDPGYYILGNHKFHNDITNGQGIVNMYKSIVNSNDTYYYMLAHDMGVDTIHNFMKLFGFGQKTGIDIYGESAGILPSTQWKKNLYHCTEQQKWYEGETISLGIGQGYNAFTILQLAYATTGLANKGILMKPHLVKEIINPINNIKSKVLPILNTKIFIKDNDINFIKRAMIGVINEGTASKAFIKTPYQIAGKTGTAQVFTIKQNEKYHSYARSERMRDHALFIAFAPVEKPKIVLALIVENGGWGSVTAAPIARLVLDNYFLKIHK